MGIGYGVRGFASGFQTGIGYGMENKKIKMIQEEQKRAEKLAKDKEENAMNWLNTNKDSLTNFQTQPQNIRNMLIFESIKYGDDYNDYLRDSEKALQAGDLEELKHLNDIEEERIRAERDMLGLGIRPENAFIGKYYSEKDMDYVKKLRMGALSNKPIGTQMYEESYGKLPETAAKKGTAAQQKINWANEAYQKHLRGEPDGITFKQLEKFYGVDITSDKTIGLEKRVQDIISEGNKAGISQDKINTAIENEIIGVSVVGEPFDLNDFLFGSNGIMEEYSTGGGKLMPEDIEKVKNNYNIKKNLLKKENQEQVEEFLLQSGIDVNALTPEPVPEPEKPPGFFEKGATAVKDWLGMKGKTVELRRGLEGEIPPTDVIPTPKVSPGAKEAMIPLMSEKELEDAIKGLDPLDPMYKLLYDEAVKRGYITK